ncbi:MAG: hypothetical protein Q8K12_00785 [Thiobacillus sp.]|nr:hypothetical protein [Thiobacillus sp.]
MIWLLVIYAKAVRGNSQEHLLKAIKEELNHDCKSMTGEALGKKLLQSVRQMKTGRAARTTQVEVSPIVEAHNASGLSQTQFAALLGVSVRTLQE